MVKSPGGIVLVHNKLGRWRLDIPLVLRVSHWIYSDLIVVGPLVYNLGLSFGDHCSS